MGAMTELGLTTTQKVVSQKLDEFLKAKKVEPETRETILNAFEMMYEYIPYAIQQGKNPSDGKILAKFLATKGMKTAKFFGSSPVNCGLAIVDLLKSGSTAVEISSSPAAGFLPAPVLAWGLAALDMIEVGNSCEFAQRAYYEAFIRDSSYVISRASEAARPLNPLP
jgi:hypothetical protein